MTDILAEIRRLRPNYQSMSAHDQARRQLLDHLEKFAAQAGPVGVAGTMPGTSGFTMATFKAEDVPVGTKLYTAPPAPQAQAEPVAWQWRLVYKDGITGVTRCFRFPYWRDGRQNFSPEYLEKNKCAYEERPLYTTPPAPQPVDTNEIIEHIAAWIEGQRNDVPMTGEEAAAAIRSLKDSLNHG